MTPTDIVALGLVLVVLILRQVQVRPLPTGGGSSLMTVLTVLGVLQLAAYVGSVQLTAGVVVDMAASLGLAVVFGLVRAATVRVWVERGQVLGQGTAVTVLLWLVSVAVHFMVDVALNGDGATRGLAGRSALLYLVITFAVQRWVVRARAAGMRVT